MLVRSIIAGAGLATCVAAGIVQPSTASADAPERFSESTHVHETWAACGPGDELVADYTLTQTVTFFSSGSATLHLQFVGSVARTGTGIVGKYAERQRDFADVDGSEKYVGLLGHLVVNGGGGFTLAGQMRVGADGSISTTTHGLAPLFELDFVPVVCNALAARG